MLSLTLLPLHKLLDKQMKLFRGGHDTKILTQTQFDLLLQEKYQSMHSWRARVQIQRVSFKLVAIAMHTLLTPDSMTMQQVLSICFVPLSYSTY